jgi:transcriptional regulator with XRE-family HTH domain
MSRLQQVIRDALERNKMSAREASLKAGLNESAVKNILNGKSISPRGDTLNRLAIVLGISPADLMAADAGNEPSRLGEIEALLRSMSPAMVAAWVAAGRAMVGSVPELSHSAPHLLRAPAAEGKIVALPSRKPRPGSLHEPRR